MPLILEGPDHVGKTTFAGLLVATAVKAGLPAYYAHMSTPPDSWNYYGHYIDRLQRWAIQDRFHLGGITYGNICRGGTKITNNMLDMLDARISLQGGLTCIIYAEDDEDTTEREGANFWLRKKLMTSGKAEKFSIDQILGVNVEYRKLIERRTNYYTHNVAIKGYPGQKEADYLIWEWKKRMEEAVQFCELPAYHQNTNMR